MRATICLGLMLAACATEPGNGEGDMARSDLGAEKIPITIEFKAKIGARPFACGQQYPGVGTGAGATIEGADFRMYVHELRMVDATGTEVAVELAEEKKWQHQNVALLDFEDKSGVCTGTSDVNHQIRGVIVRSSQPWKGIRFKLGVPFALNHGDVAKAQSPLNLTSMFWSWQGGYKFLRVEGQNAAGMGFIVHLGSTGCIKDGSGTVTSCQSPNRPEISLSGFDPATQGVVVDLAALLGGTDLSKEVECMSGPGVADCPPIFARLGLPYGAAPADVQQLFRIE